MFKSTGKGMTKKPAGGYGTHGKPKQPPQSQPSVTTGNAYTEAKLAGRIFMKEALNVSCPPTQKKGRVTNKNGAAP